jgi:hypothetical protein
VTKAPNSTLSVTSAIAPPPALLRHRSKERPALEVLAVSVAVKWEEVVPVEERVRPHFLDPEPRVAHLGVARLLRMDLSPNPYRQEPPLLRELCSKGPLYDPARTLDLTRRLAEGLESWIGYIVSRTRLAPGG